MQALLHPNEVDELLRYPRGRAVRLARAGKILSVVLPDGEIRFTRSTIEGLLDVGADGARNSTAPRPESESIEIHGRGHCGMETADDMQKK